MSNLSLIYGIHAIQAVLTVHPERITHLFLLKDRTDIKIDSLRKIAQQNNIPIDDVSRQTLDKMAEGATHQGVAAQCHHPKALAEQDLKILLKEIKGTPFILILDGIQDPHNLGACFRSAEAAGVHAIIVPKDKSASITPAVIKAASGAVETMPFIQVTNLVRAMETLKAHGIWIYGADAEAKTVLYQTNLSGPLAIVLGAEGKGIRRLTREHCDGLIKIPMFGRISSLNVSVAAGIFLFEAVRQRS